MSPDGTLSWNRRSGRASKPLERLFQKQRLSGLVVMAVVGPTRSDSQFAPFAPFAFKSLVLVDDTARLDRRMRSQVEFSHSLPLGMTPYLAGAPPHLPLAVGIAFMLAPHMRHANRLPARKLRCLAQAPVCRLQKSGLAAGNPTNRNTAPLDSTSTGTMSPGA